MSASIGSRASNAGIELSMSTLTKKQHFVPRWLLARFACPDSPRREHVMCVRKGGYAFRAKVESVGYGNNFYGQSSNGVEASLAKEVDGIGADLLRQLDDGLDPAMVSEKLASLVYVLFVRTKSLRDRFTRTTTDLIEHYSGAVADGQWNFALKHQLVTSFDSELEWAVRLSLDDRLGKIPRYMIRALGWKLLNQGGAKILETVPSLAQHALSLLKPREISERGHIQGMMRLMSAETSAAISAFRAMRWRLMRHSIPEIVLGDGVVLRLDQTGLSEEEPSTVCLPISPHSILLGERAEPISLDVATFNLLSAACSTDAYYAAECKESHAELVDHIGTNNGLLSPTSIKTIIADAVHHLGHPPSIPTLSSRGKVPPFVVEGVGANRDAVAYFRNGIKLRVAEVRDWVVSSDTLAEDVSRLWHAPSDIVAGYAVIEDLPADRLRMTVHHVLPISFEGASGEWCAGVGGMVGVARGAPIATVFVSRTQTPCVVMCRDTNAWSAACSSWPS